MKIPAPPRHVARTKGLTDEQHEHLLAIAREEPEEWPHGVVMLDVGGPSYVISVNGARITFEMHPYSGPMALDAQGDILDDQPQAFLDAAVFWDKQGRRVEDGLCVWDRTFEPEPILRRINSRNFEVLGYTQRPAEKGE